VTAPSRTGSSWCVPPPVPDPAGRPVQRPLPLTVAAEALLRSWVAELVATPGLTAIDDPAVAWSRHVEEALAVAALLAEAPAGPIVDVGSGGGSVGIPVAAALPEREVVLIEAERRKCDFLETWAARLPNLRVVWGRVEEQGTDWAAAAVAKALAPPPVAAEWLLPLVAPGGLAVLVVGPSADEPAVAAVAARIAAEPDPGLSSPGLIVLRKTGATPPGFPRRVGVARKRPLA
jgi:16S rRNA (guanine527-N7)-methyltransferase